MLLPSMWPSSGSASRRFLPLLPDMKHLIQRGAYQRHRQIDAPMIAILAVDNNAYKHLIHIYNNQLSEENSAS